MGLRAVLFDFGNTLVSTRLDWNRILPANLEGLKAAIRPMLLSLDADRLGRDFLFFRSVGRKRAELELLETPATESLRQALAMQDAGLDEERLQACVDAFFAAEEKAYPLIFGVPETLAKLKEMGLKLAVVSNATCGKLIRRALRKRRQLGQFDHVAVSADLGPCKPDPALLFASMHALEVKASDCVMVGDRLDADIEGARRAGMRSVLTDFFGEQPGIPAGGPRPDAVVRQPQELVDLFKSWRSD